MGHRRVGGVVLGERRGDLYLHLVEANDRAVDRRRVAPPPHLGACWHAKIAPMTVRAFERHARHAPTHAQRVELVAPTFDENGLPALAPDGSIVLAKRRLRQIPQPKTAERARRQGEQE